MARSADTDSITNLLKAHNAPLSAVKANKLLLEKGILMEMERESGSRPRRGSTLVKIEKTRKVRIRPHPIIIVQVLLICST